MKKYIEIVLAVLLIIVLALSAVINMRKDKTPPVITFTSDPVYYENDDKSVLLVGVSAVDDKDGNVNSNIVVERVSEISADDTVTVTYAAKDKAGNVSKATRVVKCQRVILPEPGTDDNETEE